MQVQLGTKRLKPSYRPLHFVPRTGSKYLRLNGLGRRRGLGMARRASTQKQQGVPYRKVTDVAISQIFLALHNPRHEPVESEREAIEKLCATEEVLPLARDIVAKGVSPIERLALTAIPGSGKNPTYHVEEGNRRICALKQGLRMRFRIGCTQGSLAIQPGA